MKVVVTGGAGFLGQRLIGEVPQRGELTDSRGERHGVDEVVAIDPVGAPAQDRVRAMVGDVGDAAFIGEVVRGADSVFHLAAVVSGAAEADFDLGLRMNLDGTRAMLEALATVGGAEARRRVRIQPDPRIEASAHLARPLRHGTRGRYGLRARRRL